MEPGSKHKIEKNNLSWIALPIIFYVWNIEKAKYSKLANQTHL